MKNEKIQMEKVKQKGNSCRHAELGFASSSSFLEA